MKSSILKNTIKSFFYILIASLSSRAQDFPSPSELQKEESNNLNKRISSTLSRIKRLISEAENDTSNTNTKQIKAKLHYDAGILHYELNQYRESINEFTNSITLKPIEDVFFKRASSYFKLNEFGYAIIDSDSQLEYFANTKDLNRDKVNDLIFRCYMLKGICYNKLKNNNKAIEEYSYFIDNYNDNYNAFKAYFFRAGCYVEQNKIRDAVYDFTSVINLSKDKDISTYKVALFSRAFERVKLKDNFGALNDLDKSILLDSTDIEPYVLRSEIYLKMGNPNLALTNANQALNLNKNHLNALITRGKSKIALKDIKGGCMDFSRAGELGSDIAWDLIKNNCQ